MTPHDITFVVRRDRPIRVRALQNSLSPSIAPSLSVRWSGSVTEKRSGVNEKHEYWAPGQAPEEQREGPKNYELQNQQTWHSTHPSLISSSRETLPLLPLFSPPPSCFK